MDPGVPVGTPGKIMARANHTGHIHSGTKNTIMGVSAVFIDGGYLEKVLKHDHGQPKIDFAKLAKAMSEPDNLLLPLHAIPEPTANPRGTITIL